MPIFKLPLSGDVVQTISPWTAFMSPIGSQLGLINVTIGQSSEPAVEADVLSDVASYGKQLGRIGDALIVLLAHFHPATPLTKEETAAIDDLNEMLHRIAGVKDKHQRKAMRPHPHQTPLPVSPAPEPIALPPSPPQAPAPPANSSNPAPMTASRRPPRGPPRRPA
jgi:hypothetical protein